MNAFNLELGHETSAMWQTGHREWCSGASPDVDSWPMRFKTPGQCAQIRGTASEAFVSRTYSCTWVVGNFTAHVLMRSTWPMLCVQCVWHWLKPTQFHVQPVTHSPHTSFTPVRPDC